MATLHITDIESAINWWREKKPSADGITACAEVRALAEVYALMAIEHASERAEDAMPADALAAWLAWYASTPDAPCIAICSTSQGDDICKGCGRTFEEVQHWTVMTPAEKRQTWRRITLEGTAWRFNRYAERAHEANGAGHAPFGEDSARQDSQTTTTGQPSAPGAGAARPARARRP